MLALLASGWLLLHVAAAAPCSGRGAPVSALGLPSSGDTGLGGHPVSYGAKSDAAEPTHRAPAGWPVTGAPSPRT